MTPEDTKHKSESVQLTTGGKTLPIWLTRAGVIHVDPANLTSRRLSLFLFTESTGQKEIPWQNVKHETTNGGITSLKATVGTEIRVYQLTKGGLFRRPRKKYLGHANFPKASNRRLLLELSPNN